MPNKTTLFLTYWYPHKKNPMAGIFIKKHAHAISLQRPLIVLALNIVPGKSIYKKSLDIFSDEAALETHQILIESKWHKLYYVLLPLHFLLLKRHIKTHITQKTRVARIHANILFPCAIVGYWLSKTFGTKLLITEHWSKINKFFKVSLYSRLGKKAYNRADVITCVSGQLAKTVRSHSSNPKITVVPNIIDSKDFYYDATVTKNKQLTFIAVAHWGREKNPFYFLNALEQLHREEKLLDFKVTIVGDGEKIAKIKSSNYRFPIDFKSHLTPEQVRSELSASHIFLHGSDFETFSVIIAEALMCGLPSIVSPVGISEEVINERNGFIADNLVNDWKEKILLCTQKQYDPQEISDQIKGKYEAKTVAELFESLYRQI